MTKKWIAGMLGVLAVAALVGVGYSAFTATATVNGTATAGTAEITVSSPAAGTCGYVGGGPAPGGFSFAENHALTVLTVGLSNLVPGGICSFSFTVTNVGTVPVVLSDQLNETSGICAPGPTLNCYGVNDGSGLTSATPVLSVTSLATLAVGGTYLDTVWVGIPAGSTSAPPSGGFSIYFTGSAGV